LKAKNQELIAQLEEKEGELSELIETQKSGIDEFQSKVDAAVADKAA